MLRISIPSNGSSELTFAKFENYNLPKPINGIDAEINNVSLLFDNEQDAVDYVDKLIQYLDDMDDDISPKRSAINDIIVTVKNDEFVRAYLDN
ncbi:hypothetical protein GCM10027049_16310 [Mucilaginibacter puniceus]